MNPEQALTSQQILLKQAIAEGIRRNEEQTKLWTEYEKGHKEVIQALEVFPQRVSLECMVPIGKRALIKGKLTHTNEIIACLGEGYFAKYSAAQAIALCKRRIEDATERLKSLEKEKNLFEMRQEVPSDFDVFGEGQRKDLIEYWDQSKLADWRVEHRRKEKEYRQKLSELKKQKKTEIRTEEDLFERLDELELEEELADELNRLKADSDESYDEDVNEDDDEDSYETDTDSADETTEEMIEKELEKLRHIRMRKNVEQLSDSSTTKSVEPEKIITVNTTVCKNEVISSSHSKPQNELKEKIDDHQHTESNIEETKSCNIENEKPINIVKGKDRRVSFSSQCFVQDDDIKEADSKSSKTETCCTTKDRCSCKELQEEDDIVRIEFKHSSNNVDIPNNDTDIIETPRDIYRIFCKPKSILKRSPNDMNHGNLPLPAEDSTDEDDDEVPKPSAYKHIVKDIQERKVVEPTATTSQLKPNEQRPVSRFRKERAGIKT